MPDVIHLLLLLLRLLQRQTVAACAPLWYGADAPVEAAAFDEKRKRMKMMMRKRKKMRKRRRPTWRCGRRTVVGWKSECGCWNRGCCWEVKETHCCRCCCCCCCCRCCLWRRARECQRGRKGGSVGSAGRVRRRRGRKWRPYERRWKKRDRASKAATRERRRNSTFASDHRGPRLDCRRRRLQHHRWRLRWCFRLTWSLDVRR